MIKKEPGELSALFYDWHNSYLLRNQSQDIEFWLNNLRHRRRILVMGAGTGRVATALGNAGHLVMALDHDQYRLNRISHSENVRIICHDFLRPPDSFQPLAADDIVFPYSSLQLVTPSSVATVLKYASASLVDNGKIWFDISTRFACREDHDWKVILQGYCSEIDAAVSELQKGVRMPDHYCIHTRFVCGARTLCEQTERWYFMRPEDILASLESSGLTLLLRHMGYGTPATIHRQIYETVIAKGPQLSA